MTAYISGMADDTNTARAIPTLEDWQHWTLVMGRAQQMLMEFWAESLKKDQPFPSLVAAGVRLRRAAARRATRWR